MDFQTIRKLLRVDPSLRANSFTVNNHFLKFGIHIKNDNSKKQGESQVVPSSNKKPFPKIGSLITNGSFSTKFS